MNDVTFWIDTTTLANAARMLLTTEQAYKRDGDSVQVYCYQSTTPPLVVWIAGRFNVGLPLLSFGVLNVKPKEPPRCSSLPAGAIVSNTLGLKLGMARAAVTRLLGEGTTFGHSKRFVTYYVRNTKGPGSQPTKVVNVGVQYDGDVVVGFRIWAFDEIAAQDACC